MGGDAYLITGRALDLSAAGSFANCLSGGLIGAEGKTLWMSALLRKESANADEVKTWLHGSHFDSMVEDAYTARAGFGYFGAGSDEGGKRYWRLKVNTAVYRSNVEVLPGQAAFLVLQIDFAAAGTARLFVNPPLTGIAPGAADASAPFANMGFRRLAFYGGNSVGQGAVDEVRIGGSFAAVTPRSSCRTPLEAWREAHFWSPNDAGSGADSADPDGDGIRNLLEYALGRSPTNADGAPAFTAAIEWLAPLSNWYLTAAYTRREPPPDAAVNAVLSTNLMEGVWAGSALGVSTSIVGSNATVKVRSPQPVGELETEFLRLKAAQNAL